jgi:ATP phosphoribosyltransferase
MTLRIVVPDGPLWAPSLELLAAAGAVDGAAGVDAAAGAVDAADGVVDGAAGPAARGGPALPVRVTTLAAADVPSYLLLGAADVGLVAKDVLLERASGLCELLDLRFGDAVLVYAIAPGAAARAHRLGRLRIATRHPVLTRAYFAAQGVHVAVVEVAGSLERAATDGLADGVVELVDVPPDAAPGDPPDAARPRVAGLTVEGVVATSSVRLVCGRGARVLHTAELGALVARLRDLTVT